MTARHSLSIGVLSTMLASALPFAVGCGAQSVTETGNPPLIDKERLEIMWGESGVIVVGKPGATRPESDVTLENEDGSKRTTTTSGEDGSFELGLSDEDDVYRLIVSTDNREKSIELQNESAVPTTPTPSTDAGNEIDPNYCYDQYSTIGEEAAHITDDVDKSCGVDSDCVLVTPGIACYNGCSYGEAVSREGERELVSLRGEINERCDAIEETCPPQGSGPCPPALFRTALCREGSCDYEEASDMCQAVIETALADLVSFQADLDTTCQSDDDCSKVWLGLGCTGCPSPRAINVAETASLESRLDAVSSQACVGFEDCAQDDGCPVLAPSQARCQFEAATPGNTEAPVGYCALLEVDTSCGGQRDAASTDIGSALDRAAMGCSDDADCQIIDYPLFECMSRPSECPGIAVIATQSEQDLALDLERLDGEYCTSYQTSECMPVADGCSPSVPFGGTVCDAGKCTLGAP